MLLQFVGHQKARCSSPDTDDFDMSLSMNWASKPPLDIACERSTGVWYEKVRNRDRNKKGQMNEKKLKSRENEFKEYIQHLTLAIYPTVCYPFHVPTNHELSNMWTHEVE